MVIAVNFDGTIVENAYPKIGRELPHAVDVLSSLAREGHRIILWTARTGRPLEDALLWCRLNGIVLYAVNSNTANLPLRSGVEALPAGRQPGILEKSPKITADIFIDGNNVGGLPSWPEIHELISGKAQRRQALLRRRSKRSM